MNFKTISTILILFLCPFLYVQAQDILTGLSSKWDDSFVEWNIYTDDEDTEGELKMRWIAQNDFTKWDYDLNGEYGRIEVKWRDDFSEWQIFGENDIITARTRWPKDYREWRVTNNDITIFLKQRFANRTDEWFVDSEEHGVFIIYKEYINDARDWIIEDEMNEDITMTMKMALTFLAAFNGSPRL